MTPKTIRAVAVVAAATLFSIPAAAANTVAWTGDLDPCIQVSFPDTSNETEFFPVQGRKLNAEFHLGADADAVALFSCSSASLNNCSPILRSEIDAVFDTGPTTAGALSTITVPTNETWSVNAILWRYGATATVGDRIPIIELLDDGANEYFEVRKTGQTLSAGVFRNMGWITGGARPNLTDGQYETQGLPLVVLTIRFTSESTTRSGPIDSTSSVDPRSSAPTGGSTWIPRR